MQKIDVIHTCSSIVFNQSQQFDSKYKTVCQFNDINRFKCVYVDTETSRFTLPLSSGNRIASYKITHFPLSVMHENWNVKQKLKMLRKHCATYLYAICSGLYCFSAARQRYLICIYSNSASTTYDCYISDSMSIQGYAVLFENVKTSATMLHSGGFTAR